MNRSMGPLSPLMGRDDINYFYSPDLYDEAQALLAKFAEATGYLFPDDANGIVYDGGFTIACRISAEGDKGIAFLPEFPLNPATAARK